MMFGDIGVVTPSTPVCVWRESEAKGWWTGEADWRAAPAERTQGWRNIAPPLWHPRQKEAGLRKGEDCDWWIKSIQMRNLMKWYEVKVYTSKSKTWSQVFFWWSSMAHTCAHHEFETFVIYSYLMQVVGTGSARCLEIIFWPWYVLALAKLQPKRKRISWTKYVDWDTFCYILAGTWRHIYIYIIYEMEKRRNGSPVTPDFYFHLTWCCSKWKERLKADESTWGLPLCTSPACDSVCMVVAILFIAHLIAIIVDPILYMIWCKMGTV